MERPDPTNPHAKPNKDRATRRAVRPIEHDDGINGAAPRTTGQPRHIRQARFDARTKLRYDVQQFGIDTTGKTLKQIRIAVAKAQAAESRGYHPSMVIMDEEIA